MACGPIGITNSSTFSTRSTSVNRMWTTKKTSPVRWASIFQGTDTAEAAIRKLMPRAARWLVPPTDPGTVVRLREILRLHAPAAYALAARGYTQPEEARRFLNPRLDDLHDPALLLGLDAAAERVHQAIQRGEKILLYGDYDVDGTTSVVILKKAIDLAGGKVSYYVPHRLKEGYGMRTDVMDRAAADGVKLAGSLDTRIRAA